VTDHDTLSDIGYKDKHNELAEFFVFVDEVDRFSNRHSLSFQGADQIMKASKFFYGISAEELADDDIMEGLKPYPGSYNYHSLSKT